jgi:dienelactone hydrolase
MDRVDETEPPAMEPPPTEAPPTEELPTEEALAENPTEPLVDETEASEEPALPPEPISQTITTSDGTELAAMLYPAASPEAPLLVLMHWAPGDQRDWAAIAPWLQNRGFQPELPENPPPCLMPEWFPPIPESASFHVFTFTFRGCEGGCQSFDREGWRQDVEAVMDHLRTLEDVAFSQTAIIGASIGADGAAYGCHYYNENGGGCQGALSLSPGGYLMTPYPEEVEHLGNEDPPTPAWCFYGIGDAESANACENAVGDHYRLVGFDGSGHGMALVVPDQDPNALDRTLEFLNQTGLCADCP